MTGRAGRADLSISSEFRGLGAVQPHAQPEAIPVSSVLRTILYSAAVVFASSVALQPVQADPDPAAPKAQSAGQQSQKAAPAAVAKSPLVERLRELRPGIKVQRVVDTPSPGIVGLELDGGQMLYGTADGKYLFAGEMYDLTGTDLVDVAEADRKVLRHALLETVDPASMLVFKAKGQRKVAINVFTDVDCGYCQKLHLEVPQLNAMGIEVRYLGYPRAGLESESYHRIVSAWCAKNPQDALTRVKRGEHIPDATCDNPIALHYALAHEMGVNGTPAIILEDGTMLPGYMPAAELAKAVGI
jgi:thiol:disulfide interchange protein DsbC